MDIFEQQEMSKSRPQVKRNLNDWYDWLINHVPKTIGDGVSRAFKTFKDKVMGLYNGVTGSGNQTPEGPCSVEAQINNKKRSHTQLDSRKQVIAFQDRVMTINILN